MRILVTGGAGFIGCNLIRLIMTETDHAVLNLDKLSYAAHPESLAPYEDEPRYRFMQCDIRDHDDVAAAITEYRPQAILHLAGESHVDRSIAEPDSFVSNNVVGTQVLLDATLKYYLELEATERVAFRFLYVSTDEVYGSRLADEHVDENAPFQPRSPYAGSKAAATHMAHTYHLTYALPVLTAYCSNNYGPWQHTEKLIPKTITNALRGDAIPVYGDGSQRRDWLYVDDNARALMRILERGVVGQGYNINGDHELTNLTLVQLLCDELDTLVPREDDSSHRELIRFVQDRPGHDIRYGMDDSRIRDELAWRPLIDFDTGLNQTLKWYFDRFTESDKT